MWQEMRKHEKKLRGLIVDYKRRSERRKEYYERIVRRTSMKIDAHLSDVCLSRNGIQQNFYKSGDVRQRFI